MSSNLSSELWRQNYLEADHNRGPQGGKGEGDECLGEEHDTYWRPEDRIGEEKKEANVNEVRRVKENKDLQVLRLVPSTSTLTRRRPRAPLILVGSVGVRSLKSTY